jgi:hypothetical protein
VSLVLSLAGRPRVQFDDLLRTAVSFVLGEVQMLEPQRTQRYTKDMVESLRVLARGSLETHT